MATTTFQLPSGFMPNIWSQTTAMFSALAPYTTAIVGVLLALVAIEFIIGAIHNRK
jgi:hypothetical protein